MWSFYLTKMNAWLTRDDFPVTAGLIPGWAGVPYDLRMNLEGPTYDPSRTAYDGASESASLSAQASSTTTRARWIIERSGAAPERVGSSSDRVL